MTGFGIGASVKRREALRLLTGQGRYAEDCNAPGQAYAAFVRSPYAHADVIAIDAAPARALAGVLGVFTGRDLIGGGGAILALGRIAHDATLRALGHRSSSFAFAHGARHPLNNGAVLFDSYHCSRYNTNTRRLTPAMFRAVFDAIAVHLNPAARAVA